MANTKTTTAKRAPAKKPARTPGPKPQFFVVEDHLKIQTSEGEKSLDLRIPLARLELFMTLDDLDIPDAQKPRWIIDNVLWPEDKETLETMRDGALAFNAVGEFVQILLERMGAHSGESSGSSEPSEPTEQPSDSTSDATSESL
jgi:hypothetical protein